jgi:hypothetical protein
VISATSALRGPRTARLWWWPIRAPPAASHTAVHFLVGLVGALILVELAGRCQSNDCGSSTGGGAGGARLLWPGQVRRRSLAELAAAILWMRARELCLEMVVHALLRS